MRRRCRPLDLPRGDWLCARRAKFFYCGGDGLGDQQTALGLRQFQLLLPVHDLAGFDKHRRHHRVSQHNELIVAVDAGLGVEQRAAVTAH